MEALVWQPFGLLNLLIYYRGRSTSMIPRAPYHPIMSPSFPKSKTQMF